MKKFGHVLFTKGGPEGAILQRQLIEELIMHGIISMNRLEVEKWYEEDKKSPSGCVHKYVLHDEKEVETFKKILKQEYFRKSPYIKWKVVKTESDPEFLKWATEVEKKREIKDNV